MIEPKDKPAEMIIDNVINRFGIPTVLWPRKPLSPSKGVAQGMGKALPKPQSHKPLGKKIGRRGEFLSDF